MIRSISLVILVAIVAGCASSGRIGALPRVADGKSSSQLVLIRVSSIVGAANSYYVALDGNDIFSLRSGEHTKFSIPTGDHYISVKCFGGWTPTWKENAKKFSAFPNQEYYFEISPNLSCAEIYQIDQTQAESKMKTSDFIGPDRQSNKK